MAKEKQYKVFKDIVAVIYDFDKPVAIVLKEKGHDIFYSIREMHGDGVIEILQGMTIQRELLDTNKK